MLGILTIARIVSDRVRLLLKLVLVCVSLACGEQTWVEVYGPE